jgi:hypothetical protein
MFEVILGCWALLFVDFFIMLYALLKETRRASLGAVL